mmetsp:Transcript_7958/g.22559  ORF Transcript_7958/g.22559 Transcript_7958/m.22559 type:complete len:385 (-) Transcript_7958:422-1576(-)
MGARVVGSSGGSVATTPASKAISFAASVAGELRVPYWPTSGQTVLGIRHLLHTMHSVLGGCLPVFVCVMVVKWALSRVYDSSGQSTASMWMQVLCSRGLPTVVATVAAQQTSELGETSVLVGALAGSCIVGQGGVIAGLIAGLLGGMAAPTVLACACRYGVPATAASITTAGGTGIVTGGLVELALSPICSQLASSVRFILHSWPLSSMLLRCIKGAALGWFVWWGSGRGMYHIVILPLIIVEMERGDPATLGAIDECVLVGVSLGLCLAHIVFPRQKEDVHLSRRGLFINFLFGDFIEGAYPFMERSTICNTAAGLAAALSGVVVCMFGARSSAYLPLPLAVLISDRPLAMLAAFAISVLVPCAAAVMENYCLGRVDMTVKTL